MTAAKKETYAIEPPSSLSIQGTIAKFSAQAVWLDSDLEVKSHLIKLCDAIAANYGKSRLDVSLNDLHSLATKIQKIAGSAGLANVRFGDASGILSKVQSVKENVDSVAYLYRFAKLALAGDALPMASKFMISIAAPRLKRASITYAAGILAVELYRTKSSSDTVDDSKLELPVDSQNADFDPIFAYFDREHLSNLCALLKIGADINASDSELKEAISNEFSYYTKNFFTHIYHKMAQEKSQYRKVLDTVCADLEIQIPEGCETKEVEQKIVSRVLQETIDKLGDTQREELLARLSKLSGVELDLTKVAASGSIAALIVGNYAGFGTYLAASSALGALTSGLGITASFGVYTSMSSAIALALGPIGVGAATAAFIATMSKSSPRKAIPAIVYIATMRAKLGTEIAEVASKERRYKYILIMVFGAICAAIGYAASRVVF